MTQRDDRRSRTRMTVLAAVDGSLYSRWAVGLLNGSVCCHFVIPLLCTHSMSSMCRALRFLCFPGQSPEHFAPPFRQR